MAAKAKRRERRGQKEARGVRDEMEREREGISKSSLRQMVRSFARGTFWNKRGSAIDVWRMVRRRFAKITVSSQKLRQLRRKRRKGSLRSKRFRASSTRKLGPERKKGAGKGGKEKLVKQARETDAGKREVATIERRQK